MSTPPRRPEDPEGDGAAEPGARAASRSRFRRTLVRVLAVQAVTLILFWVLQARYHG